MTIEAQRGCGYRKVGGIYLVAEGFGRPCGRFPILLEVCPSCGQGIKQSRGWTWVDTGLLFASTEMCDVDHDFCRTCPLSTPAMLGRAGLLWIGAQHYETPDHFNLEARNQGISRRISQLPKGFVPGETWVLLAHPHIERQDDGTWIGGVFRAFRPEAVEVIRRESERGSEQVQRDEARGMKVVYVPDGDPDHDPDYDPKIAQPELFH